MKRFTKYKCQICKSEFVTDRKEKWTLDTCKCGKTMVDDSEGLTRSIGAEPILVASADTKAGLKPKKKKS